MGDPDVMSSRVCVACLIVRILPAHLLPGCLAANPSGEKGWDNYARITYVRLRV